MSQNTGVEEAFVRDNKSLLYLDDSKMGRVHIESTEKQKYCSKKYTELNCNASLI